MSENRIVTVPSGADAGRRLCRSERTLASTSAMVLGRASSYGTRRVPTPASSGAAWAPSPMPHPSSGHIGQKYPPPPAAQMAISITLTTT